MRMRISAEENKKVRVVLSFESISLVSDLHFLILISLTLPTGLAHSFLCKEIPAAAVFANAAGIIYAFMRRGIIQHS